MGQRARASASSPLAAAALLVLLSFYGAIHAFQHPISSIKLRRHRPSIFTFGRQPLGTPRQQQRSPSPASLVLTSPWALAAQPSSGGGIDGLLRLIRNDALSLTIGSLCLVALVANRLLTPDLYDSQSRTDIIGVISAGGLLLNGLTLQDVAVREAEAVELQGDRVDEADTGSSGGLTPRQAGVLRWAADTYMQAFSSVASVLIWHKGRTLLRKGIVAPAVASATGGKVEVLAIAQKALTPAPDPDGLSQPTYIPDLQVLPGRVEFVDYLPALCQGVVLQPFDDNRGLVILGVDRKRVFTPKDLTQARVVAQKVQRCLREESS